MRLENKEDFECARERLRRRDPNVLAALLMFLARVSGPAGEQVSTFVVGMTSPRPRIRRAANFGASTAFRSTNTGTLSGEIRLTLDFIVDSVEHLVLPKDPKAAFELLVTLFKADAVAMKKSHECDSEVARRE